MDHNIQTFALAGTRVLVLGRMRSVALAVGVPVRTAGGRVEEIEWSDSSGDEADDSPPAGGDFWKKAAKRQERVRAVRDDLEAGAAGIHSRMR